MSANPSWYDLLAVDRHASADEIRAAWRSGIADLDPTDRRFTVLNRAAEVLLDPKARKAYDTSLEPEPPSPHDEGGAARQAEPAEPAGLSKPAEPAAIGATRTVPGWLLTGLAVVTLVVAGVAAYLAIAVPSDRSVEDATAAAQSAAERAVVPILSYDGRHLEESRAAAEQYLTADYREQYGKLFDAVVEKNAAKNDAVVKARLLRSSIERASGDRVQVFLLVDQSRTNKAYRQPQVYQNWVTVTMEKVDGDWLVAGMNT